MRALGRVAGRTSAGLPELAAIAADPSASEEQRLRAIEILGSAADARTAGRVPEATQAARAQWLAACEPEMKGGKPGKKFETCLRPASFAIPDDKERARLNLITHILSRIPYKTAPREKVKLPKRKIKGTRGKNPYEFKFIPEVK